MKNFNIKPLSLMVFGAALLTGCAATQHAEDRYADMNKHTTEKFNGGAVKSSAAAVANDDINKSANFSKTNRNWIDPVPLPRVEVAATLPDLFLKNVSMTMPGTVNAVEVLSEMQRSTGVKFQLSPDVYDTSSGQGKLISAQAANSASTAKISPLLISDFVFRGSLSDALNLLASKANVSWKWNGREVEVFRFETKTYNIAALAGVTNTSSNIDLKGDTSTSAATGAGGGGQAGAAGKSNSSVTRTAALTTWDEVKSFIISQLSSSGTMAVLESAGAVTIKDIPSVHKRVEKSINDLNTLLSKQVYLNVDIYSVSTNDQDNVGVDWNLVWGNSKNNFNFLTSAGQTGLANGTVAIPARPGNGFNIGVLTGPFKGTSVIMNALSSIGKTSVLDQFAVTTLNGQPTPIASNRKQVYLASTKVTPATATSGAVTELTPGEISAGINLNVTPKIEPNGNILLEYAMNLSDVEGITPYVAPDGLSGIQMPTSNLKSVLQRASLRSGQTLVLSGFKQSTSKFQKSGIGSPAATILGGSHDAGTGSQYLVITVTPYIANSNAYMK